MIRRYNMQRSDNFPLSGVVEFICDEESGKSFVYTGFPVKSAIVSLINVDSGVQIMVDNNGFDKNGFYVIYSNSLKDNVVKFSYQVI